MLITNKVLTINKVGGIESGDELIEKSIKLKTRKLLKSQKLFKSEKSKSEKLAKSKKPSKCENSHKFAVKKTRSGF